MRPRRWPYARSLPLKTIFAVNLLTVWVLAGALVVSGSVIGSAGIGDRQKQNAAFQPSFETVSCPQDVTADDESVVTCGYLEVLEDRSDPTGRTIQVFVARVEPKAGASGPGRVG